MSVGAVCAQNAPELPRVVPSDGFLFRQGRTYQDYSFADYVIPDSSRYSRVNHYGPMGNFLIKGYDVYNWTERRTNTITNEPNSLRSLPPHPDNRRWDRFDKNIVVKESYKDWASALILGSEIRTQFTPLTLRLAGFDGVRLDTETRRTRFTAIAQRWNGPAQDLYGQQKTWTTTDTSPKMRDASLLLGGHGEVDMGAVTLGATAVDWHIFDAEQGDFSLRGGLQSVQALPSYLIVRFADDSPEDDLAGAAIQVSSIRSFLPRARAARSIVCRVTEGLAGSSSRSSAERLVCIRLAIAVFDSSLSSMN